MVFSSNETDVLISGENVDSYTADGPIEAQQAVKITGDYTVAASDTDGEQVIGVAMYSVADGDEVAVAKEGTEVVAQTGTGTISAGDLVASHGATGEEGQLDTAGTGDSVLGFANEADGGSQGDNVEITISLMTNAA